jgi:hypothetical protein
MGLNTTNSAAFINDEQYSRFILTQLPQVTLGDFMYRNVSDFGSGTTLNIKSVGSRTLQDVTSEEDMTLNPIDSSTITLTISDFKGDAVSVPDDLREDGDQIERLLAESAMETTRLIAEDHEASLYQAAYDGQTAANPNDINGFSHRFRATGGNEQMTEADLIDMALAFDEANVPMTGRVAIVPPVVAATFNKLVQISAGLDRTPMFQTVFESTFVNNHKFVGNIFGWDIYTSTLLPDVAAGTSIDGTNSITNAGKACLFLSVLDDNTKSMMSAWRRAPRTRSARVESNGGRDELYTTARWGHGVQRLDSLGVIVCDATVTA